MVLDHLEGMAAEGHTFSEDRSAFDGSILPVLSTMMGDLVRMVTGIAAPYWSGPAHPDVLPRPAAADPGNLAASPRLPALRPGHRPAAGTVADRPGRSSGWAGAGPGRGGERAGELTAARNEATEPSGTTVQDSAWRLRSAFAVSSTGDWIYRLAVPLLVLKTTGSAVSTAFAYTLEFVPYIGLGLVAGVFTDRADRRRMMVSCDVLSAVLALGIAIIASFDHPVAAVALPRRLRAGVRSAVLLPRVPGPAGGQVQRAAAAPAEFLGPRASRAC